MSLLYWLSNLIRRLHLTTTSTSTWPLLIYSFTWVTVLTLTVAVTSFSPELAFVSAISPSSSFSHKCNYKINNINIVDGGSTFTLIRVPLDAPGDTLCFPLQLFVKSKIDAIIPPIFAAVIVAASACVVRAVGLWEHDDDHDPFT